MACSSPKGSRLTSEGTPTNERGVLIHRDRWQESKKMLLVCDFLEEGKGMEIKELRLDEIHPYKNNPRNNDAAVEAVANSIREFGFRSPIIVDKDNVIICGHTRYKASQYLELEKVPVVVADDLTEEQVKAYRLADNKVSELATWNNELLQQELDGISDIDMTMFDFEKIEFENIDNVVEDMFKMPRESKKGFKEGDMFQLGSHYLLIGDSTKMEDVEKLVNGNQIDLLYTDPPYNVDVHNADGLTIENDNLDQEEFRDFITSCLINACNVLKSGGAFYIWHAQSSALEFMLSCQEANLVIKQCLIWNKNSFNFGRQDYKWKHEPCLYGWKPGEAHYFVPEYNHPTIIEEDLNKLTAKELIEKVKELEKELTTTTIFTENKPIKNDLHPTMKPVRLCAEMIKNSTIKGENVLDLFGGSGSTLIACEQIERKCFMMEHDPYYAEVIISRWEDFTGKKAKKING